MYLSKIDYNDVTYTSATAVLMTAVEPSLAVILACIPLLRPWIGQGSRRFSTAPEKAPDSAGFSKWVSSGWSKSKTPSASRKRSTLPAGWSPGMLRLGSSEIDFGVISSVRSAVLSNSRYDSDDMELRYVLNPGEGVSHHARVEVLPQRDSISVKNEAIRQQLQDVEAGKPGASASGGFAIVVKQEWNVEIEPKCPP